MAKKATKGVSIDGGRMTKDMFCPLYICDKTRVCHTKPTCGTECNHTTDPIFAKNKGTVSLFEMVKEKFEIINGISELGFVEQETEKSKVES